MSLRLGAETARDRLVAPRAWLAVLLGAAAALAVGVSHRAGDARGADRALLGLTLPIFVPFLCYALFESVYRRASTAELLEPVARHGALRPTFALGVLLTLAGACALATALLVLATVLGATAGSAELVRELDACAWGGSLTGAAYAGLFGVGSLRGRAGRLWLLAGDFVFGSGSGIFALPWPRGHARDLLGGGAVLGASPLLAAVVLLLLAAGALLYSASRGPS